MRVRLAVVALAAVALAVASAAPGHAAESKPVDATLAVVADSLVTLGDVTLARALGLFGLERADGPVTDAEVERYLDGQLAVREAHQLDIDVPDAELERAWEAAGGATLGRRLEALGIDPAWARRLIEADLRGRRLLDLRVRSFVFVTEADVDDALGAGPRDEATRAKTRTRLEAEAAARSRAEWREDARERIRIRRIPAGPGPWPAPFSLKMGGARRTPPSPPRSAARQSRAAPRVPLLSLRQLVDQSVDLRHEGARRG
jgi:hypothetical protein